MQEVLYTKLQRRSQKFFEGGFANFLFGKILGGGDFQAYFSKPLAI